MFTIPDIHSALEPIVCWSNAFTDDEIDRIIKIGDSLEFQEAKVGANTNGISNPDIRTSSISWIRPSEETSWLFNKLAELISRINTDKFQFNLSHIDHLQYTTYSTGGFYSWHIDAATMDTFGPGHRKLGISIMLSSPEIDFTGGDFQIIPAGNPSNITGTTIKKGDVLAFPSFVPHQVCKVLSGKRKSLVCWVLGPKFK